MLLLTHIVIAIGSLLQATYGVVSPSRAKLRATYGLVAATLATGTYLVVSLHSPVLQSCMSGLIYVGTATALSVAGHYRLARQSAPRDRS